MHDKYIKSPIPFSASYKLYLIIFPTSYILVLSNEVLFETLPQNLKLFPDLDYLYLRNIELSFNLIFIIFIDINKEVCL